MQESLRIQLLGPLRVSLDEREVILGPPKQRAVLGILAARANRAVSRDQVVDGVWGADPPASAANGVHIYVAGLRRALEPDRARRAQGRILVSTGSGYMLRLGPGDLDIEVFGQRLNEARERWTSGDDPSVVIATFDQALALWRGVPFSNAPGPFAEAERLRLTELRLTAIEDRAEVMLSAGRHNEILAELPGVARDHPLRERIHGPLIIALYRSGRQAEALWTFARLRQLLVEELGVEPTPQLQRLHQHILTGEATLGTISHPGGPAPGTSDLAVDTSAPARVKHRGPLRQVPEQLPRDVPGFTGRHAELGRLEDLLATHEAEGTGPFGAAGVTCVIDGTAGVGKTALAVHWAHQVASRFRDGQLYVNLRGFDPRQPPLPPGEALCCLLRGMSADPQRIPGDVDDQAAMFRTLLSRQRMLLILDNAATARQVRPLLPGSPGCLVLVTSRNHLAGLVARDGAQRIPLGVLDPGEAVALLARVIGTERVNAESGAAAELARMCGNLPLALRIAAERVAGHPPLITLADLVAELAVEAGRLDALAPGEDEDTAIRSVFSWSYRALPAGPARLFRLLGLHAGPEVSAAVAAVLAETPTARVRPLLTTLSSRNLLEEIAQDRYRLHELLRLYAAERAAAEQTDQDAAILRMLTWYLHTADAADRALVPRDRHVPLTPMHGACPPLAFASHQEALEWCDIERANLVAATGQAAQTGHRAVAWQLPAVLWDFFNLRKHWTDWLATCQIGLAAARHLADREGEAWILGSLGVCCWDLRRFEEAVRHFQQSRAICRERGDRHAEGICMIGLGNAYQGLRRYQEALGYHRQALAICREQGDRWGEGLTLNSLSTVYQDLRRYQDAIDHYQQTLAIYRELGDRWGEGATLGFLGDVYKDLRRYDEAVGQYLRALPIRREAGDQRGEARTLHHLGDVCDDLGRYEEAIRHYRQALAIQQAIGDLRGEARTRDSLDKTLKVSDAR
jgi:DNA-binding SARP family transcriptional activator/tetratricopeptide (TPR) repeat protein